MNLKLNVNVMKQKIILLLVAITLLNGQLIGNNERVIPSIETNNLMEVAMNIEINGAIKLYSVLKEEIELINTEIIEGVPKKSTNNWHLAYNRDYFIGYSDTKVEAITPSNFKRIAKKYFANIPGLAASIGKRGFRYKNLPTIILYYNKHIIQGKAITKTDKLFVKEIRQ